MDADNTRKPQPIEKNAKREFAGGHDDMLDTYFSRVGDQFMQETQKRITWVTSKAQGHHILDVGCGHGLVLLLLAREGYQVTGIDSSKEAISSAEAFLAEQKPGVRRNVTLINDDFAAYTFGDQHFDTVVISEVLEQMVNHSSFVIRAAQLLNADGRLIVTLPFVMNDFVDRKRTYYALEPMRLVWELFSVDEIEYFGKGIGFSCSKRETPVRDGLGDWPWPLIEQMEEAFQNRERREADHKQRNDAPAENIAGKRHTVMLTQGRHNEALVVARSANGQALLLQERIVQKEAELEAAREKVRQELMQRISSEKELIRLQEQIKYHQFLIDYRKTGLEQDLEEKESLIKESQQALEIQREESEGFRRKLIEISNAYRDVARKSLVQDKQIPQLESELTKSREEAKRDRLQFDQQRSRLEQSVAKQEKQIIALEVSLKFVRNESSDRLKKLEETDLAYRNAAEQCVALKNTVSELTAELTTVRDEAREEKSRFEQLQTTLEQTVAKQDVQAKLADEILKKVRKESSEISTKLNAANLKYRAAIGEIARLKDSVATNEAALAEAKEGARKEQEQRQVLESDVQTLTVSKNDLDLAVRRMGDEYLVVSAELANKKTELVDAQTQIENTAAQLREREARNDELEKAVRRMSSEYIVISAELADKKKELVNAQTRIDDAATLCRKLEEANAELESQNIELHAAGKGLAAGKADLEQALQRMQSEYLGVARQLATVKNELRDAQQQAAIVTTHFQENEKAIAVLRAEAEKSALVNDKLEQSVRRMSGEYLAVSEELQAKKNALVEAELRIVAAVDKNQESEKKIDELRSAIEKTVQNNEKLDQSVRRMSGEYLSVAGELAKKKNELAETQKLIDAEHSERIALQKEQQTAKEELERTLSELSTVEALRRASQHQVEKLKLQVLQSKRNAADIKAQAEKLRQQKLLADNQVTKTRATISFQLGYLLLHGFKSVKAVKALPGQLIDLGKESKRRKIEKQNDSPDAASQRKTFRTAPGAQKTTTGVAASLPGGFEASPVLIDGVSAPDALKNFKVACIMDEFTYGSYQPECNLLQLTPQHWENELAEFMPELLFIESAWRGKEEKWGNKVGHKSDEVQGIVSWCRSRRIPTVFWNKEDPIHFETFLSTAKLFDYVFTTDIDCIHRYKGALGHDRVYLLPFACQPSANNPLETYERKDAFCFAGAYYVRYPERTRDLGNFVSSLATYRPVEIYDRNYGKSDPNYQFPEEYQPFIVGNLPFDQIDRAYKGYRYAINLNSIKQSQTMFARRVFDLLASNTITVSNFSRGVRLLFGDLVVTTDSGDEIVRRLEALGSDDVAGRKYRLAGLRKIMQEHTYQDRLAYVVSKVQGRPLPGLLPRILVTAYAKNQQQLDAVQESFQRQTYAEKRLLIVTAGGFTPEDGPQDKAVQVLSAGAMGDTRISELLDASGYLAAMVPDDYYGPHYLQDLALATRYSAASAIGKVTQYVWSSKSGLGVVAAGKQYQPATGIPVRSALAKRVLVEDLLLRDWIISLYSRQIEAADLLGIDEFNYCKNGNSPEFLSGHAHTVNDREDLDLGIGMDELMRRSERIETEEAVPDESPILTGEALSRYFKPPANKGYKMTVLGQAWEVESTLADEKIEYLYAATDVAPAELGYTGNMRFHFDVTPGLNLQLVMYFLDAQKQRISNVVKTANRNQEVAIPAGAEWIRLGLRIYGGGTARINALVLGHRVLRPAEVIGRAEHLVLTNQYPSYDDLYRNGFVHSRVAAYNASNVRIDVFRLRNNEALSYHEFQNVDVISGSQEALNKLLQGNGYKNVLVHFLDDDMWRVLQHHVDRINLFVWVHGAEIQPWYRRDYNFKTDQQRDAAKIQSEARMTFWRGLLKKMPDNLKLIFVSKYFSEEVMEDLGFRIPEANFTIIHNPIDTELFEFHEKSPEQRKKILSIRSYFSRKYANDLSVRAIQILSSKSWFNDLEFRLIGDGELFDEILAPLRTFNNVYIERRFMTHAEIAALHREYGIFLCPTRMDAQGVSKDEAMSSGLIPVTNNVTAIPEFVDASCGILAEAEDAEGMAAGIADLYIHPEKFTEMSLAASQRVRRQSSAAQVIQKELNLFSTATVAPQRQARQDPSSRSPVVRSTPLAPSSGATRVQESQVRSFLSFDVEALPGRASDNLFDHLVWGKTGNEEFGIRRICSVLRQHKLIGNFMIDFSAALSYGDVAVQKVVDYLISEGHEVHTHLHSEWVLRSWGLESGDLPVGFDRLDYRIARSLLDYSAWKYRQFTGMDGKVFRPGAFLFNRHTLLAARDAGFTAISAFRRDRQGMPNQDERLSLMTGPFLWDNGLAEIPVDYSPEPLSTPWGKYLSSFDRTHLKKDKTFNLVLHSWSLAKRDENGHHPVFTPEYEERLHQICDHIKQAGAVVGYGEYLAQAVNLESVPVDLSLSTSDLVISRETVTCRICGALVAKEVLTTDVCPACGSRSRHRQVWDVFRTAGNPFEGKSVIVCHAIPMEKQAFLSYAKTLLNFDVRPVSYVDQQMDIQNMEIVANESFECFFALHVLNHVKDDGRAVSEIFRVLKPGGVAVLTVPYQEDESTIACANTTEHYGVEALEKYEVGTYRNYGKNDFLQLLSACFTVREYDGLDEMTGESMKVFYAYKPMGLPTLKQMNDDITNVG